MSIVNLKKGGAKCTAKQTHQIRKRVFGKSTQHMYLATPSSCVTQSCSCVSATWCKASWAQVLAWVEEAQPPMRPLQLRVQVNQPWCGASMGKASPYHTASHSSDFSRLQKMWFLIASQYFCRRRISMTKEGFPSYTHHCYTISRICNTFGLASVAF